MGENTFIDFMSSDESDEDSLVVKDLPWRSLRVCNVYLVHWWWI